MGNGSKKRFGSKKTFILLTVALAIAVIGYLAFFNSGRSVQVVSPEIKRIQASFREPAQTRLKETWTVTAPISGRIDRIQLEPGDRISGGATIAHYDRVGFNMAVKKAEAQVASLKAELALKQDNRLEETRIEEIQALIESTKGRINASEARVDRAKQGKAHASRELDRIRALAEAESVSASKLDDAQFNYDSAVTEWRRAKAELSARRSQLKAIQLEARRTREQIELKAIKEKRTQAALDEAKASLKEARHSLALAKITAPTDSVVLERFTRGGRPVEAGMKLLELGKPENLEVVTEVLTEDALKLTTNSLVTLKSQAGDLRIEGAVRQIEPAGFTKVSSLGVEQQRVNVIVSLKEPPRRLGIGYRLHARFVTAERSKTLVVPRYSVMEAVDGSRYLFVVENGHLRKRNVTIGLSNDWEMEIVSGVTKGARIVAHPDSSMSTGLRVTANKSAQR